MEFFAPHDKRSQMTSLLVSASIALLYIFMMSFIDESNIYIKAAFLIIFIIIVAIPYILSVRRYELADDALYVNFLLHKKKIPVEQMLMITYPIGQDLKGLKKTFGSFGYFGYSGKYKSDKYGAVVAYTNKMDDLVLLDTGEKKYLLGPYDSEKFYHLMKNFISSKSLPKK
ncbi:MAG: PH domain-containing protein [Candidatus Zixiibacteriota bacterium]